MLYSDECIQYVMHSPFLLELNSDITDILLTIDRNEPHFLKT